MGLGPVFVMGERGGIGDGPLKHMEILALLSTFYIPHSHLTLG